MAAGEKWAVRVGNRGGWEEDQLVRKGCCVYNTRDDCHGLEWAHMHVILLLCCKRLFKAEEVHSSFHTYMRPVEMF